MTKTSPFLQPAFWLWLALAAWPPEILASLFHWEIVDPAYVGILLVWWPIDALGRLGALALFMDGPPTRPSTALPSALAAEVLLGIKTSGIALLGAIPGLAWLSVAGMAGPRTWGGPLVLVLLGLLPSLVYGLKRLGAPILILRDGATAPRALAGSARIMDGRLRLFLAGALPWLALSWALDLGSMALPESVALALAPLSYAAGLQGLWRGWGRLA